MVLDKYQIVELQIDKSITERTLMRRERTDPDPNPVSTSICDPFEAEAGAQVTFTSAPNGASIDQISGDAWPFCGPDGEDYGPPINFPLPGATEIYVKEDLTVGDTYPYSVLNAGCTQDVTKGVTIIDGARMRKSA
jgi:hypothetical protein